MKRLAIIGSAGIPGNYGGFETLTENLVKNLSEEYEITVYCSGKQYPKEQRKTNYLGAKLRYIPLKANGFQSILYDYISILKAVFTADTLLVLGVSGCTLLPLIHLFSKKKIIVNIDGLEWKRKKWNKSTRWFLKFSEKMAVKYAHIHVADNAAIKKYVAMHYGIISHVIEYGGDHAINVYNTAKKQFSFELEPYCFKVARIEPENNIQLIIEAFVGSSKQLIIVGNWENSTYGNNLKKTYQNHANIHLLDPIYDPIVLGRLRGNAEIYLHGHEAGGTNPSLVEAMWLGLPIFAYNISFNRETTENSAVFFQTVEELKSALQKTSSERLKVLGAKMSDIAQRRYKWSIIAEKYSHLITGIHQKSIFKEYTELHGFYTNQELLGNKFEELIKANYVEFKTNYHD